MQNGIAVFSFRMFTRSVDSESRRFQKASSREMIYTTAILSLPISSSILFFRTSYGVKTELIIAAYLLTENEFGYTDCHFSIE